LDPDEKQVPNTFFLASILAHSTRHPHMTARQGFLLLHLAVLLFGLSVLIGKTVESPASVVTCLRSLIGAVAIAVRTGANPTPSQPAPWSRLLYSSSGLAPPRCWISSSP
jgi:uncharacterized membrane protein